MPHFRHEQNFPMGSRWECTNDDYRGEVIGYYITKELKEGVVLQLDNARVVHVYQTKWLQPCSNG